MNNIAVSEIKTRINNYLLNSPDSEKDSRETMIQFLETLLRDTNNYQGWDFLSKIDMQNSIDGLSIGINLMCANDIIKQFENTDHTRVRYL